MLESLSDRDMTKWEIILGKTAWEVFTHMQYLKDYNAEQKRIFELAKHGH